MLQVMLQVLQLKHKLGDPIISIAELLAHNLTNVLAKNFGSRDTL